MKKSEFSEKFYEILIDHEILNKFGWNVYIPSQNDEADKGFDALFGDIKVQAIALQFKVPSSYERIPKGFKSKEVYRFHLHQDKNGEYTQHNKLVDYNISGNILALYVAPLFLKTSLMLNYSSSNSLLSHSVFLHPKYKILDKKSHFMIYDKSKAEQHSKQIIDLKSYGFYGLQQLIDNLPLLKLNELKKEIVGNDNTLSVGVNKILCERNVIMIYKRY